MDRKRWKIRIKRAAKEAGTYQPFFDQSIDTLAGILERRDQAEDAFNKLGGQILVRHTNKSGATNVEQNPALRLINDMNRDALAYWKELGLTPAGLKRINETAMDKKAEGGSALETALLRLSEDA